jgi:hypothetical protein
MTRQDFERVRLLVQTYDELVRCGFNIEVGSTIELTITAAMSQQFLEVLQKAFQQEQTRVRIQIAET